jgi:hypothetical protein
MNRDFQPSTRLLRNSQAPNALYCTVFGQLRGIPVSVCGTGHRAERIARINLKTICYARLGGTSAA